MAPTPAPAAATVSISSLSPATAIAGSDNLVITIGGSGFQAPEIGNHTWSFAVWSVKSEGVDLLTRYVSDTQLTAIIPANLPKNPASAEVSVVNGDVMGWSDGLRGYPQSNALTFAVVVTTALNTAIAGKCRDVRYERSSRLPYEYSGISDVQARRRSGPRHPERRKRLRTVWSCFRWWI
jgi:hypothetical protein